MPAGTAAVGAAQKGATSGPSAGVDPTAERGIVPPPAMVPGQRRYRDGDRVRHHAFGEGRVVTSKLTRDDEEVTVAFPDRGVKTLLASIAGLEVLA